MSQVTPPIRDLAARLIAHEAKEHSGSAPSHPAVFHACERLRPHLATLMGQGGFRALLARALTVAGAEVPWLAALEVDAQGALAGWDKSAAQVKPKVLAEGGAVVVGHLLALLVAFIGNHLTLRLVREVWPDVAVGNLHFTQGDHP